MENTKGKYAIEVSESSTLKERFGLVDLELVEDGVLENFITELGELIDFGDPFKAEYFGESYDGELYMYFAGITKDAMIKMYEELLRSVHENTCLTLIDYNSKVVGEVITLRKDKGTHELVYTM